MAEQAGATVPTGVPGQQLRNPASVTDRRLEAQDPRLRGLVTDPEAQRSMDLTDIMYASAGKIFGGGDQAIAGAWQQRGRNITSVLQERWFQKEMETFEQQALNPAQQRLKGLEDSLMEQIGRIDSGQLMSPDGTVQAINPNSTDAARIKQQLLYTHTHEMGRVMDEVFQSATRYGTGNPLIANRLLDIMSAATDGVSAVVNPAMAESNKAFMELDRMQAGIGLTEAQTDQARAAAEYSRAAAKGTTEKDDKQLSFRDLVGKYGIESTTAKALEGKVPALEPFRAQEQARMEADIKKFAMSGKDPEFSAQMGVAFDEDGNPVSPVNEDSIKREATTRNVEIMERATKEAFKSWYGGDTEEDFLVRGWTENRFKHLDQSPVNAPSPKWSGLATKGSTASTARAVWEGDKSQPGLKKRLEEAVAKGKIRSPEDIPAWAAEQAEAAAQTLISTEDPQSRETAKAVGEKILAIVSEEWKDIPLLKERFNAYSTRERVQRGIWESGPSKWARSGVGLLNPEDR